MGLGEPLRVAEITDNQLRRFGITGSRASPSGMGPVPVSEVDQSLAFHSPKRGDRIRRGVLRENSLPELPESEVDRAPRKRPKHSKIDARNAPHGDKHTAGDDYCHDGNLKEAQPTQISVRPVKLDEFVGARERDPGFCNAAFGGPAGRTPPRIASRLGSRLLPGQITDDLSATSLAENGNIRLEVIVGFDKSFA